SLFVHPNRSLSSTGGAGAFQPIVWESRSCSDPKKARFRDYDPGALRTRGMTIVQSWNTALKGDLSSDYPVGTTWAMDGGNYYLLDLVRVRAAIPTSSSGYCPPPPLHPLLTYFRSTGDRANA